MIQEIKLMDVVSGTSSNAEAMALYIQMDKAIGSGRKIRLSLHNSTSMSSSFLNSSFGELFDKYGMGVIREHLTLIDFKPSHAAVIKEYLQGLQQMTSK